MKKRSTRRQRGMEDCPDAHRGAAAAAAARLPDELILEILSLLPARSINRFKCVSKRWRDLIGDPLHQKQLPQTLEGFFCSRGVRSPERFISLPGRQALLIDVSFSFLTKQPGMENLRILGSCNGLVLFERCSDPLATTPLSYVVCNPATEQWVAVPSSGVTSQNPSEIHLIFDPAASPHFHLLRVWQQRYPGIGFDVRAYSSETRGWSDGVSDQLVNVGGGTGRSGRVAFVNGMLYFIMWRGCHQKVAMFTEGKPRIVPLPDGNTPLTLFVAQSQGPLHCLTSTHLGSACPMNERGLYIWVLEDYDAGHWVPKHGVSFSELFEKLFRYSFSVVSIHPDCDGVFFIRYCDLKGDRQWKVLSYDMHSKEVHALDNFGHVVCPLIPYVPYFSESSVLANKH